MTDDASSSERAAVISLIAREQRALADWALEEGRSPIAVDHVLTCSRFAKKLIDVIERGDHLTPDPQEHLARRGR